MVANCFQAFSHDDVPHNTGDPIVAFVPPSDTVAMQSQAPLSTPSTTKPIITLAAPLVITPSLLAPIAALRANHPQTARNGFLTARERVLSNRDSRMGPHLHWPRELPMEIGLAVCAALDAAWDEAERALAEALARVPEASLPEVYLATVRVALDWMPDQAQFGVNGANVASERQPTPKLRRIARDQSRRSTQTAAIPAPERHATLAADYAYAVVSALRARVTPRAEAS